MRHDQAKAEAQAAERDQLIGDELVILERNKEEEASKRAQDRDALMFPVGEEPSDRDERSLMQQAAELVDARLLERAAAEARALMVAPSEEEVSSAYLGTKLGLTDAAGCPAVRDQPDDCHPSRFTDAEDRKSDRSLVRFIPELSVKP
jgi:hypothetical protein